MIVTDVGGLKETIGDRGTGIVSPDGSPEAIRAEIERYFSEDKRELHRKYKERKGKAFLEGICRQTHRVCPPD